MAEQKKQKREKLGKIALDLMQKAPETRDPIELERAMQSEYMKNLFECIDDGVRRHEGPFFVVVITKNERLMPNVFRNYFFSRTTCPTPDYDQTVFRYNTSEGSIEYIWTIPTRDACIHLLENAVHVIKEEQQLLKYVLDFTDGTLYRVCKKWNKEEDDSNMLKKDIIVSSSGDVSQNINTPPRAES